MISAYALRDVLKRSQHPVTGDWVPIDVHIELAADHDHHYAIAAVAEHVHHIRTLGTPDLDVDDGGGPTWTG